MTSWTEQDEDTLRRMVREGYTGSEIASVIKKTRNSVVGKAARLQLGLGSVRKRDVPKVSVAKTAPARTLKPTKIQSFGFVQQPFQKSKKYKPFIEPKDSSQTLPGMDLTTYDVQNKIKGGITILDLHYYSCRAILGPVNGVNTIYCGEATVIGKSFCPHHCLRYFRISGQEENKNGYR